MPTSTDAMASASPNPSAELLYERLARLIADQVADGTLQPGDRVPSVRRLARERGVSVQTVIEAYRRMENRGLLEARPRSGFYVRRVPRLAVAEPRISTPRGSPQKVRVGDLIMEVIEAVRRPDVVSLGAAYPAPGLLPLAKLGRLLAAAGRGDDAVSAQILDPRGCPDLRRAIARRARWAGSRVASDELIITNGATEALALALRAVAGPGDAIAVESPTYFGFLQLVDTLGMRAVEIATDPGTGLQLDALERAVERASIRAVVVVPHFQNPLGARMPEAAKANLVRFLSRRRIALIEDDLFGDLSFDGTRPTALSGFDDSGIVLACGSFSKVLAPGFRVGWLAPRHYADTVLRAKVATTMATSAPVQMALARYLEHGGFDNHLRRLRRTCETTLAEMRAEVAQRFPAGTRMTNPQGGFLLWIELPAGCDAVELHRRAAAAGISVAPGPIFSPTGRYRRCLRLNAGQPWSPTVKAAIGRLGRLAASLLRE